MFGTRYLPAGLILLAIAGLATENLTHYPIGVMCLLGLYKIRRDPKGALRSKNASLLLSVFACVWIPMLLAMPDAVNPGRALKTTLLYFHFLPAGLYVIYMLRDLIVRRIVWIGLAIIIGLLPVLNIIPRPMTSIVAERFTYFPMLFYSLLICDHQITD